MEQHMVDDYAVMYRSRLREYNESLQTPMTQQEIADRIGKKRQSIYRWYSDEPFEKPDLQIAAALARMFNNLPEWRGRKKLTPFDMLDVEGSIMWEPAHASA
jgi:DNA-binding XRE family transcriptional regulator